MMRLGYKTSNFKLDQCGFTLVELVIIIVTLSILAAVAIPKFSDMAESSKITATRQEMLNLKLALVGNPEAVSSGEYIDRGFEGDVGHLPPTLSDLVNKPDSIAIYNSLTRLGWNGPYIDATDNNYLQDAWGVNYSYEPSSRRLRSVGGSDTITVYF